MGQDDAEQRPGLPRLDLVESGADHEPGRPRSVRRRGWWLLLTVAVLAVVVLSLVRHRTSTPSASSSPSPPNSPAPTSSLPLVALPAGSAPPVVRSVGRPLLAVPADWELFGRGPGVVVRIQPAIGRVTVTPAPPLASSGPVFFLAGPDRVIVRPLDQVAGYMMLDGRPAQRLPPSLDVGGPALPGPDGRHVWMATGGSDHQVMALTALDGTRTRTSITVPAAGGPVSSDGSGYLVVTDIGGAYDARPDGLRRITTGVLLAVGPTRWLTAECDDEHHCGTVAIDRETGARRVLGPAITGTTGSEGVISPDGRTAALLRTGTSGTAGVHLLDLVSGRYRRLDVPMGAVFDIGTEVWSPDGRWLLVAGNGGRVFVVDSRTARVGDLGIALPPVTQLAARGG